MEEKIEMKPSSSAVCCVDLQKLGGLYQWLSGWLQGQEEEESELLKLPVDAIKLVLDRTPLKDRLNLRNVCHRLRNVSDSQPLFYNEIKLELSDFDARVKLNSVITRFEQGDTSNGIEAHINPVIGKVKSILQIPKLHLKNLHIEFTKYPKNKAKWDQDVAKIMEDLKKFLAGLPNKIHVKNLTIAHWSLDALAHVLPYLNPTALELVVINDLKIKRSLANGGVLQQISKMDQWNQTKMLRIDYQRSEFHDNFFQVVPFQNPDKELQMLVETLRKLNIGCESLMEFKVFPANLHNFTQNIFEEHRNITYIRYIGQGFIRIWKKGA